MKRNIILVAFLFVLSFSLAQSVNSNYVQTKTMLSANGQKSIDKIVYYDGLGRPVETTLKGITPEKSDLVTLTEYSASKRVSKKWLPLPVQGNGEYITPSSVSPSSYGEIYQGDSNPYEDYYYENSPHNRVRLSYRPGSLWRSNGRGISSEWLTNTAEGELACRKYVLTAECTGVICKGTYAKGSLYVVRTTDEEKTVVLTFSDALGQKILERKVTDEGFRDTYYVYTDRGDLAFVLPAAASEALTESGARWEIASSETLGQYAYHYQYDRRGRCVMKKLPGCDAERMCYDASDRLVFREDGNLRQSGRRQFFLYDALGREAVRGTCKSTTEFAGNKIICATYTGSGLFDGYSANIDLADVELMQTTYYDDYAFLNRLPVDERNSLMYASRSGYSGKTSYTCSLPTGSVMHQLDDMGSYTVSVSYYDVQGRVVCQRSTNHLGGAEVTHTNYTFTSKPKKTYHIHTAEGHTDLTEEHSFSYDHADRLISEQLSVNGGTAVKISRFKYNSIGQIDSKTFGNGQTVKYSYNLRGWTTGISNKLFSETLTYNTDVNGLLPDNPVYNGNISAIRWKSDNLWRGYQFRYDRMGRLTESIYGEGSSVSSNKGRFNEKVQYDCMGNVLSVQRNGKFRENVYGPIDDLTMEYEGNRLVKADDAVDGPYYAGAFHFVDGADEEEEYSYDANGNVTSDLNKNIARIDYNCLNLPTMIRFGDGSKYMSMKYDAAGRLLRRTTRVPFKDIAVGGKLQQERAKADLAVLSSIFVARNGAAASAASTAGSSSASSAAPSFVPSTTSQGAAEAAGSSGASVATIKGKVSKRAFGMTDYDYCGNVEYTNDKAVLYHSEGYVTFDKNQQPEFHYYLKDHLGNVRVVVNERDSVEQVTHYYPFGGSFGDGVGSSVQDYLYSGKELTRFNALNWYNYGARWYDPTTLRWNGVDPMAEKYTGSSPFIYCINDPVNRIDLDGNDWIMAKYGDYMWVYYDSNIHSQMDIYRDYYGGNPPDECDIQYIGEDGVVYNWDGDEKNAAYKLISNGTFVDNEGNIYADEVFINDSYGKLTLATDVGKIFEKDKGKNWYGSYLGPNNPQIKVGNKTKDYYGIPPINQLDFSAYIHDKGYDTMNAVGPAGVAFNFDVAKYDLLLAHMAAKDAVTTNDRKRSFVGIATSLLFHKIGLTKLIMNKIIQ